MRKAQGQLLPLCFHTSPTARGKLPRLEVVLVWAHCSPSTGHHHCTGKHALYEQGNGTRAVMEVTPDLLALPVRNSPGKVYPCFNSNQQNLTSRKDRVTEHCILNKSKKVISDCIPSTIHLLTYPSIWPFREGEILMCNTDVCSQTLQSKKDDRKKNLKQEI